MAKVGRPRIVVDWGKVDGMLGIQCTGEEIASVLGISYNTIERRCKKRFNMNFDEYSKEKRKAGHAALRRRQWEKSKNNPALLIWLGKQWLGQKDKQDVEHTFREYTIELPDAEG